MSLADLVLIVASFIAGAQNALAGGGSFLTFPALLYSGLDPRSANITSTIALFPAQITTGLAGRSLLSGAAGLSIAQLIIISLIGGVVGAGLLLLTPVSVFTHLVPFLVLFATALFAWGSLSRKPEAVGTPPQLSPRTAGITQFAISIYGGYFGGGIGILMLAALTAAGLAVRNAGATKNVLAGVMNASAVVVFVARAHIAWQAVLYVTIAAIAGGQLGVYLLRRINETVLRTGIIAIGAALTIWLFLKS
jgi:uncharacterized membrane protein YfcA